MHRSFLFNSWGLQRFELVAATTIGDRSEHGEWMVEPKNPGILGPIPTLARFGMDEHRTGVRWCKLYCVTHVKDPGQSHCTGGFASFTARNNVAG